MLGAKLVIKLFFVGYELYKQKAPSRVLGRNDLGVGAKRLGIKFGAKRLGAKRLGANWSWGETTCYRYM